MNAEKCSKCRFDLDAPWMQAIYGALEQLVFDKLMDPTIIYEFHKNLCTEQGCPEMFTEES